MEVWRKVGLTSNLCLKRQKKKRKKALFFLGKKGSEGRSEIEGENLHLLSTIYGDRVVGIRRAKI